MCVGGEGRGRGGEQRGEAMRRGGARLDSGVKMSPNDTLIVRFKVTHLQSVSVGEAGVGSGHFPGSLGEIMGCLPKRAVSSE